MEVWYVGVRLLHLLHLSPRPTLPAPAAAVPAFFVITSVVRAVTVASSLQLQPSSPPQSVNVESGGAAAGRAGFWGRSGCRSSSRRRCRINNHPHRSPVSALRLLGLSSGSAGRLLAPPHRLS
ncbi:unnamed protein product [Closterium sp. NIES-54]